MFTTKRLLVLANVDSTQNPVNGDRVYTVSTVQKVICDINLVGIQTQQLGSTQGIAYTNSLEIDKMRFKKQKYAYYDNTLYEIKGRSKAKDNFKMLLNVVEANDEKVKTAIESYLGV